jgi:hypothetical protein
MKLVTRTSWLRVARTPILVMAIGAVAGCLGGSQGDPGGDPAGDPTSNVGDELRKHRDGDAGSSLADSGARDSAPPPDASTTRDANAASDSSSGGSSADTSTPSPDSGNACYLPGDGSCGPYDYPRITNSNGYNTYVGNQMWGCGSPGSCGPETLTAYGPDQWSVTSTQAAGNTAVLTYPDVQQLFNNWGNGGFNGGSDTPISGLAALVGTYAENMHETSGTIAEAAYDIWTSSGEIMIWVDTTSARGSGGADPIDTGTLGGLPFTFYVYGGAGGLPIIKLDTSQRSGTIDILAGLQYLQSKGYIASNGTLSQVNFGWEICSTGGVAETFDVTSYSLTATPK